MTAPHSHDDGFKEIQLNSKQLVFLFMAATVVSAVIFLCGVMVGRGVRAQRIAVAQAAALNEVPEPDAVPPAAAMARASIPAGGDPTTAAPPSPVDELGYPDHAEEANDSTEDVRPAAKPASVPQLKKDKSAPALESAKAATAPKEAPAASASAPVLTPAVAPASPQASATGTAAQAAVPAPASSSTGGRDGYAVQVAAVNVRTDADAIVKRLTSKGYSAYVQTPPNGTSTVFRVRVGTFKTRREADVTAAKLQAEEHFKPWVTR